MNLMKLFSVFEESEEYPLPDASTVLKGFERIVVVRLELINENHI